MMKTPWFPMSISPVHDGVYQVKYDTHFAWSRWECGKWHLVSRLYYSAQSAVSKSVGCYDGTVTVWRGISL